MRSEMHTEFCWKELKKRGYLWKDNIKVACKGMMGFWNVYLLGYRPVGSLRSKVMTIQIPQKAKKFLSF